MIRKGRASVRSIKSGRSSPARTRPVIALPSSPESLEDRTYHRLRSLILNRSIRPGDRIDVDRVAAQMGISRTPVVTALKRLSQEWVVELRPRRGSYVRRFSKQELLWLFQIREALEGLAARLVATRVKPKDVARLAELFRGFEGEFTDEAIQRYLERDRHFHWRIVELARNNLLTVTMDTMNMMYFTYQEGLVRLPRETLPEHLAILEALSQRDPARSEAAMRLHIRRSSDRLQAEIEDGAMKDGP